VPLSLCSLCHCIFFFLQIYTCNLEHKYQGWLDSLFENGIFKIMLEVTLKKSTVHTSHRVQSVLVTKVNNVTHFSETVAVYCVNENKHANTQCEQNVESFNVKESVGK
jgi:hypothetical protein